MNINFHIAFMAEFFKTLISIIIKETNFTSNVIFEVFECLKPIFTNALFIKCMKGCLMLYNNIYLTSGLLTRGVLDHTCKVCELIPMIFSLYRHSDGSVKFWSASSGKLLPMFKWSNQVFKIMRTIMWCFNVSHFP